MFRSRYSISILKGKIPVVRIFEFKTIIELSVSFKEKEKEVIPMDIKELMREIIAEVLLEETLIEESVIESEPLLEPLVVEEPLLVEEPLTIEPTKTPSDRKLRKRRKKSL